MALTRASWRAGYVVTPWRTRCAWARAWARLRDAQDEPSQEEPTTDERDRLAADAAAARSRETELRLTLRTREERARSLAGRAESL